MNRRSSFQPKCNLKGNQRNVPCLCGSGLKAKKCHPNGYQFI
ncbi:SEC-C metal-binding domain-containing protein [Shewanella sp. 1180_01]